MYCRYPTCHNLYRYPQFEMVIQNLSKLVNAVADDRRGCLCVGSKLAYVRLQLESQASVACSMCISWNSSFCREPYVVRRCATSVMDCNVMCELLIVIVQSVVLLLSHMVTRDRERCQSHAETYARSNTKEPVCLSMPALRVRVGHRGRLFRADFGTLGVSGMYGRV